MGQKIQPLCFSSAIRYNVKVKNTPQGSKNSSEEKRMKCPGCGNEVSREEAFCGQCGAPNKPPVPPTEMVSAPPPPVNGRLNSYAVNPPIAQSAPRTRQLSGNNAGASYPNMPPSAGGIIPSGPNQGPGFYHDATEAMSSLPGSMPGQMPPQSYPQGSYPVNGPYGGGPVQGPYPTNNFAGPMYVPQPTAGTGQAFMYDQVQRSKIAAPPAKRQNNTMVLVVSFCIIVALASVIGVGALVFLKGQNGGGEQAGGNEAVTIATATPAIVATATPTIDATATANVNATATPADATPTPGIDATPTPIVTTTVAADPGFQWCTPTCNALGYQIEYPMTWAQAAIENVQGYQYTNSAAPDEIVAVKATGQTGSQPGDLLTNDLQTNFGGKPGYTPPATAATTATIGGTTWLTQTASYLDGTQQPIRVTVYATVYQQKAYIIELQANNTQFDGVNQQTFTSMLKSFTFQAIPAA